MPTTEQIEMPFAALDFSGRATVTLKEIALKLGVTVEHLSHLVEDGTLIAVDLARSLGSRALIRVPIEEYRRFVISRLTGEARREFIANLPVETLREIHREIGQLLTAA